jgi:NADPH-dependent 2,4-dienoyl-CoA reductase/sulfur reductase-like enzyme
VGGVHVLRTLDDALAIRARLEGGARRVVVVGAGFIGGEVAASCRERGAEVTMVEVAEAPLERQLGARVGLAVAELHRAHGVDVRLGIGVEGVEGFDVHPGPTADVAAVRLGDGSVVAADLVVVGVGVAPSVGWLEGSGLTLDDGVVCDATLSAAPGVVAAGDVARWPSERAGGLTRIEHWEHAIASGEAAARRLLHDAGLAADPPGAFDPVPWFWSDQYDRKLQLVGTGGPDHDLEVVEGSLDEHRFVGLYGRDGRVTGVVGMNRPAHVVRLRRLVVEGADLAAAVAEARA